MDFQISTDAERVLELLINSDEPFSEGITLEASTSEEKMMNCSSATELENKKLCNTSKYIYGPVRLTLTSFGKDYFMQKKKHEEKEKQQVNVNINASNNSPVNFNAGSGQANQTVSIYTTNQQQAINEFKEVLNECREINNTDKKNILELLEAIEENTAKNRTSVVLALIDRINSTVATSVTLQTLWANIVPFFGV